MVEMDRLQPIIDSLISRASDPATEPFIRELVLNLSHDFANARFTDYMEVLKKQHSWGEDPEENERRYTKEIFPQSVPRLGKLRDTATLTTFLASPLAGYINGAYVRIDGGLAQFM